MPRSLYLKPLRTLLFRKLPFTFFVVAFFVVGCETASKPFPVVHIKKKKPTLLIIEPVREKKEEVKAEIKVRKKKKPAGLIKLKNSKVSFTEDDLGIDSLKKAIKNSLVYFNRLKESGNFLYGEDVYTVAEMKQSMKLFLKILETAESEEEIQKSIARSFELYKSPGGNDDGEVLFTAYFEPVLSALSVRSDSFRYPAYALPEDLKVLRLGNFRASMKNTSIVYRMEKGRPVPYYSRKEIMSKNILEGKAKPLAWFRNPVDLFFLQIQGSGIIRFEDNSKVRLGYAGANGHDYYSIGRLLIKENKILREKVSMQSIRKYLKENKGEVKRILYSNSSYTFFQYQTLNDGPFGNINVSLTPFRSIATDYKLFPKGGLALIETNIPNCHENRICEGEKRVMRFVLNQDTGGAIRGYGRADIFMGRGVVAEETAGKQNSPGKLWFLVAKKEFLNQSLSVRN